MSPFRTWASTRSWMRLPGTRAMAAADEDLAGEQAEEQRGLAEGLADAALGAGGLADGVGGRERDDRGGQRAGAEQADREQLGGEPAGDRGERLGGLLGRFQRRADVDRRGGRDDDEDADHVAEDRPGDGVELLAGVVGRADPAVGDRGGHVELHVRGDRGPDQRHHQEQERLGRPGSAGRPAAPRPGRSRGGSGTRRPGRRRTPGSAPGTAARRTCRTRRPPAPRSRPPPPGC